MNILSISSSQCQAHTLDLVATSSINLSVHNRFNKHNIFYINQIIIDSAGYFSVCL